MGDEENRLARIEKKLDNLIDQFRKLETTDVRQEMRLEQLETRVNGHGETLKRCFERLETLENKPARVALKMWGKIGSIALTVIVTALITFILVYIGVTQ
jgi:predicted nuclease with TOPRIM domain